MDKKQIIESLEKVEINAYEYEKESRIDVDECRVPSNLFSFIATSSFYRAMSGNAEELYPNDLNIKEHVKSSKNLLVNIVRDLTQRFETECKCTIKRSK